MNKTCSICQKAESKGQSIRDFRNPLRGMRWLPAAICFVWLLETSKKYNFWCTAKFAESHENLISDSALLYLGCTNGQMMTTALLYTLPPPLLGKHSPSPIQLRHPSTPQQITFFLFRLPERNKFLKTSICSSFPHLFEQIPFVITLECVHFQTTIFIL